MMNFLSQKLVQTYCLCLEQGCANGCDMAPGCHVAACRGVMPIDMVFFLLQIVLEDNFFGSTTLLDF